VQEVRSCGERLQAQAGRTVGDAGEAERGFAGFVEGQLQVIAVEQVDAVEGRILRRGGDLRDDVVVLADQAGPNGLRGRIGSRRGAGAESRTTTGGKRDSTDGRRGGIVRRGNDEL